MNKMPDRKSREIIIRQHRHWTRWLVARRVAGEGNLVLTNRRLLFLHRIESSPNVTAAIRELADAPIEKVLNHALTLHKNCFQIWLNQIKRVTVGIHLKFLAPVFYLKITYQKSPKHAPQTASFQFLRPRLQATIHPQLIADIGWVMTINRALQSVTRR